MNKIRQLRIVGIAEGVSFLILLFIAMPLKYLAGYPIAVTIAGSLHGLLFVLYLIAMLRAAIQFKWEGGKIFSTFLAALYPLGTFILDPKLRSEEKSSQETS